MTTEQPSPAPGYVYFIRDTRSGQIKIGHAGEPVKRLRGLQLGNPYKLVLLGVVPGGLLLEKQLHGRFAAFGGGVNEWFRPADELLAYVEQETRPYPLRHSGWINPCAECRLPAPEGATCCQVCDSGRKAA